MAQRRTHKKSKLGCQSCKRRHIKCDEGRPACVNCVTTERQCLYMPPRPRRVRSTSPQTSNVDAIANSSATSPASTLPPPAPAMSSMISTPSSFAISPVVTPASLLRTSFSHSGVNLRHMELLSNFILEVIPSLSTHQLFATDLVRAMMPVVLFKPFLLLEVLALSALHLSRKKPGQADDYRAEATALQIEALTSFDEHLGSINSDNCEAMLLFASLLGIHSLGEAVIISETDADGFLDRFVTYLNLHRGVQTVTSQAWAMLLKSNISPVLHQASDQLMLAEAYNSEEAMFVASELNRLLENSDLSAESKVACDEAVSRLKLIYQAEDLKEQSKGTQQNPPGLIWAWPSLLSGVYTDLLQKRQPEALIVLCYFAVILHRRRSLWFVDNAGRLLIESVTKSLGSYWRHWLNWPNEIIGNTSMSRAFQEAT